MEKCKKKSVPRKNAGAMHHVPGARVLQNVLVQPNLRQWKEIEHTKGGAALRRQVLDRQRSPSSPPKNERLNSPIKSTEAERRDGAFRPVCQVQKIRTPTWSSLQQKSRRHLLPMKRRKRGRGKVGKPQDTFRYASITMKYSSLG